MQDYDPFDTCTFNSVKYLIDSQCSHFAVLAFSIDQIVLNKQQQLHKVTRFNQHGCVLLES